ncbi:fimbrial protein [Salmonella enterica subsp. enterica serovar Grumpensis]|nr:fimbrial protein [Salmonella enterica subsp. enterica serovar Grumpensis]
MKKTLIALAVATSAVVSGSAMAWTASGSGGNLDLGGTLTPPVKTTPWEVQVGSGTSVTGLDAEFTPGNTTVTIPLTSPIPVLGIRTKNNTPFNGAGHAGGLRPMINYNGKVDINGFNAGFTTLTLDVTDAANQKIGSLSGKFGAAAAASWKNGNYAGVKNSLFAENDGFAFWGGVGTAAGSVVADPEALAKLLFPGSTDNFNSLEATSWGKNHENYFNQATRYSGFYGSGIDAGTPITITLDSAPTNGNIVWKASLPVTVTYK